jgi:hypothetical protein
MAALEAGLAGVTTRAKGLEIAQVEGQVRMRSDRMDMVDLEPAAGPATDAGEAVVAEGQEAEAAPALASGYFRGMSDIACHGHDNRRE